MNVFKNAIKDVEQAARFFEAKRPTGVRVLHEDGSAEVIDNKQNPLKTTNA